MTCATCKHAKTESKDMKTTRRMERFGSAVCAAYSKQLQRPLLIPLNNAGGMVCNGRMFEAKEGQGSLI